MPIELVVFDMAGTTVCGADAVTGAFRDALGSVGLEVDARTIATVMGLAKPVAIRTLLEQAVSRPNEPLDRAVSRAHHHFVRRLVEFYRSSADVRECDGASTVFRLLHDAGIKVSLDTGFSRDIVSVILDRLSWQRDGLIDATVASDEVSRGRPFPDLIERAMTLTGIEDVRRVAKVGDTPADLQQGSAAGCGAVVGITGGTHTREELRRHPHTHLIDSLRELPPLVIGM